MTKNEIATTEAPALPSMYTRQDDDFDSGSLSIRKVYLMQDRSGLVRAKVAQPGDVVVAHDSEDAGADFLIGGAEGRESYIAFILDYERFVARIDGGDFEYLPRDYQRGPDERDVWVGYNYLIAIPEVDEYLPVKQMFVKTSGTKVYQKINTYIKVAKGLGSQDPVAVEFKVREFIGKASKQPYFALVPRQLTGDEIPPGQLALAKQMLAAGAHLEKFGAGEDTAAVETADM